MAAGEEILLHRIYPHMKKGFTLIELIMVIVIIGILMTFAAPQYMVTKERALDREAQANLGLLQAAQRVYRMEHVCAATGAATYYPDCSGSTSNLTNINTNLRVQLNPANWTYTVFGGGSGTCTALRTTGARIRTWTLTIGATTPTCSGSCF